jgi:hypothetical protein
VERSVARKTVNDRRKFRRNMLLTSSGPKSMPSQQQQAEPTALAGILSNIAWPCDAFVPRCFVIAVTAARTVHSVTRFVQSVCRVCPSGELQRNELVSR